MFRPEIELSFQLVIVKCNVIDKKKSVVSALNINQLVKIDRKCTIYLLKISLDFFRNNSFCSRSKKILTQLC